MLVKGPRDPRRFSGTIVIEPLNPSAGFDVAAVWDRSWPYFVRQGDAFVGWTSTYGTISTLKQFNPTRYGPLTWGQNSAADDGITFDIAAQIGALFKRNGPESPTHRLQVRHVFEAGFSEDGSFTFTQADVFNALERLPSGGPAYDGYVPGGTIGPVNVDFGLTPAGALPPGDPRDRMQPRDAPVIQINTETEATGIAGPAGLLYRRPDSNASNDRYRLWEVPGASHISNDLASSTIALRRDIAEFERIPPASLAPFSCSHERLIDRTPRVSGTVDPNTYPFSNVANAAFEDLTKWLDDGLAPPHAARIKVTSQVPTRIVRDRFGNALGGLRTPFVDVPTTTYSPTDTVAHPTALSGFCVLLGYNTPFTHATLHSLYATHRHYVVRVARESRSLVRQGFWLRPDARQVVQQAAMAAVP